MTQLSSPFLSLSLSCAFASIVFVSAVSAQSSPPPTSGIAPTLEIPTLVVDHQHRPVGDLHADQFQVQVDDHAAFAPLAAHIEQTEPLSLTILLDASRDSYHDLAQIGDELAGIATTMFLPQDRISLYALDCTLVRSLYYTAPTPEVVLKAVSAALTYPKLHDHDGAPNCGKSVRLWDNLAPAIATLSKLPGRRVLLLVSSGHDGGSKYDWQTVQKYATDNDVAIFAIRDQRQVDADTFIRGSLSVQNGHTGGVISPTPSSRDAIAIELICANAGGLILNAIPLHRNETLAYLLFIVRNRFILTIPADAYPTGASHKVKVTVPHSPFFVSPAGVGEPQTTAVAPTQSTP